MAKPLIQTGPLLQDLGHQSNRDMKQDMALGWAEPISDLRLYCQDLIARESPQEDKWEEKRHFWWYVLVQSVGEGQVERWHLEKARECCSKHGVVAEARETGKLLSLEWVEPVLQGQRALRVDGPLTVLGNYSPLPWITAEAPGNSGDGATDCQTLKNMKQKNLWGILPASQDQGSPESWNQRCTSLVFVCSDCLCSGCQQQVPSTAQGRGHQGTQKTSLLPAGPAACHSMAQAPKADEAACFPKH